MDVSKSGRCLNGIIPPALPVYDGGGGFALWIDRDYLGPSRLHCHQ